MSIAQEHHTAARLSAELRARGYEAVPERFDDAGGPAVRRVSGVVDLLKAADLDILVERHPTAITRNGVERRAWVPEWASTLWINAGNKPAPGPEEILAAKVLARDPERQRVLLTTFALGGEDGVRSLVAGLAREPP